MTKKQTAKPQRPGATPSRQAPSKNPFAQNANFNQQARKVLAKHYRAKFGVK